MFVKAVVLLALASSALASPLLEHTCSDEDRTNQLNGIAPAFSDQTPGATAEFLRELPLKDEAQLIVYVDGLPGITVATTDDQVRSFALTIRQFFSSVYPTSVPATTNFPNGTSTAELEIPLGPRIIALPINIHAGLSFNYDLADCKIEIVQGFLTIPSQVAGVSIDVATTVYQFIAAFKAGNMPS